MEQQHTAELISDFEDYEIGDSQAGRTARKPGNGMTRAALAEHAATTKPGREKNNLRGASRAPTPGCESHFENAPRRGRVAPRTLGERVAPWILYLGWGAGARAAQRQATKVRHVLVPPEGETLH